MRSVTDRTIKITIPGPFTMAQQTQDAYYRDERALALDLAAAANEEVEALFAAGADVVQLDEPYLQPAWSRRAPTGSRWSTVRSGGARDGRAPHVLRLRPLHQGQAGRLLVPRGAERRCCRPALPRGGPARSIPRYSRRSGDKTVVYGVVSAGDVAVETRELVASRIRAALRYVEPSRLSPAPDCGMKYLPRDVAFAKLRALTAGASIVRAEL